MICEHKHSRAFVTQKIQTDVCCMQTSSPRMVGCEMQFAHKLCTCVYARRTRAFNELDLWSGGDSVWVVIDSWAENIRMYIEKICHSTCIGVGIKR